MASRLSELFARATRQRRNLWLATSDACSATPMVYINVGGNFIIAALVTGVFAIDNRVYGLISSLPSWCNALQVFLVPLLAKRFNSRGLAIGGALGSALVFAVFTAVLPWMPRDNVTVAERMVFAAVALSALAQSFAAVGWTSWVQDWLPQRLRGKYFGARNRLSSIVTVFFFLFVGWITEVLHDGLRAYGIVFGVATILRLLSVIFQARMDTPAPEHSNLVFIGWTGQLSRLSSEKSLLRFIAYGTAAAFFQNLAGPFYPVFAYKSLGLRVDQYSLLVLLATAGGAVSWPWWGRFADKHGCRNAIVLSVFAWSFTDYWWPLLHAGHSQWPLYFIWMWGGAMSCGFLIGTFNWLLKLLPAQARVAGVSLNLATTSFAAALAPIISGSVLQAAQNAGPGAADTAFRILFFLKPTCQIISLLLLRGIVEPETNPFQTLLGAMRTQRQVLVAQFLPFVANFQPARVLKRFQSSDKRRD